MAYGYTKLFGGDLLQSSVWQEDLHVKVTWIAMLSLTNERGIVEASVPGLARSAGVTIEQCEQALAKFLGPDKYSRTKDHEGRRIKEVEGGWFLLNHAKYRAKLDVEDQREKARLRMQAKREAEKKPAFVVGVDIGKDGRAILNIANEGEQPRTAANATEQVELSPHSVRDVRHTDPDPTTEGTLSDQASPLSAEASSEPGGEHDRDPVPPAEPREDTALPLPPDWVPDHDADLFEDCRALGIDVASSSRTSELSKFQNNARGQQRVDWQKSWRGWLVRAIEYAQKNRKGAQPSGPSSAAIAAANREKAERERAALATRERHAAADREEVARIAAEGLNQLRGKATA